MTASTTGPIAFTAYQKFIVGLLAFLQFTIVLDFMILSPLGAVLMKELDIPASRFGVVVSVYAFSAGASGLLAAGFADRFDRKRFLLFFYAGFVAGTLACALAPTYETLLAARMITGLFGGVIGSISFAIIADLFPPEARGRVMGVVQTAFAASQVLGIPLALVMANRWSWHAPFFLIVAVSSAVGVVIVFRMKPIVGHLVVRQERNPFQHLLTAVSQRSYVNAYTCTILLATGGFMLMPFGSTYVVNNMGIALDRLPIVYVVTGVVSIIAGPFIGRLSDAYGKYLVFCAGSLVAIVMVVVFTNLGPSPLWLVALVNTLLMVAVSSRMISASALVSIVPDAKDRGAFMAVNSSIQQISGGVAASAAGLIVVRTPSGALQHYDTLGYVVVGAILLVMVLLYSVDRAVTAKLAATRVEPRAA